MVERLKRHWREFADASPGERFENLYERSHASRRSAALRAAWVVLALFLIAAGIVLMPAPGPGIAIVALGAGLLATQSRATARLLDRLEPGLRAAAASLKRRLSARRERARAGERARGSAPGAPRP